MDKISWNQNGYKIRRSATDIQKDLDHIKKQNKWILEGVFGKMAQECLLFICDFSDLIGFIPILEYLYVSFTSNRPSWEIYEGYHFPLSEVCAGLGACFSTGKPCVHEAVG